MLQTAERLSKEIGSANNVAVFHSYLGWYFTVREAKPLLGIEYCEKSLKDAQRLGDIELLARVAHVLITAYHISGQFSKIPKMARVLITSIECKGKERESFGSQYNLYSWFNVLYGSSVGWCGNFAEGRPFLETAVRFAAEIDHKCNLGVTELLFGFFHCAKGEGDIAVKHFQSAIKHIEEVQFVHLLSSAWAGLGWDTIFWENKKRRACILKRASKFKMMRESHIFFHDLI
jgi:hypothetical protein